MTGTSGGETRSTAKAAALQARRAGPCRLLLDYDGTLVPMAQSPELAIPDGALLDLLARLAACPGLHVEIVSGRPRDTLDNWFGELPIALWAEHGFWHRASAAHPWEPAARIDPDWAARLLPIFEQFTSSTPGARIERKTASIAWHFRGARPEHGVTQAHELRRLLSDALRNQPLEVLEGKKVIEVRFRGISKAVVADRNQLSAAAVIAFGDDRTDEDLFLVLPSSSVTIAVERRLEGARYFVNTPGEVRDILDALLRDANAEPRPANDRSGHAAVDG